MAQAPTMNPIAFFLTQCDGMLDSFLDIVHLAVLLLGLAIVLFRGDVRACFHYFPAVLGGLACLVHADRAALIALDWRLHVACVFVGAIAGHLICASLLGEVSHLGPVRWIQRRMWRVWRTLQSWAIVVGAAMISASVENFLHGARALPDDLPWCFSRALNCAPKQNPVVCLVFVVAAAIAGCGGGARPHAY